jgi:heme/copper-type cytochrome/quinol oxidase subunit 2
MLTAAIMFLASSAFSQARTVEMVAGKDNQFRLVSGDKVLHLKAGEKIHFKINSEFGGEKGRDGSVHSFVVKNLRDQGWDVRLREGSQEFDLTAPSAGEYLIECTVKCGPGHDTMNFRMLVQ